MKPVLVFLGAAAVLALAFADGSLRERAMRFVHRGKYVFGEVLGISKVGYGRGRNHDVHVRLKTASGQVWVYLGPSWFLNSHAITIVPHDVIEVSCTADGCHWRWR